MKKTLFILLSALLYVSDASAANPADPNATPITRTVLNYLTSLPSLTSKRVVSGAMADDPNVFSRDVQTIFTSTGKWPGMLGGQYVDPNCGSPCSGATQENINNFTMLQNYWGLGGLLTIVYSPTNPKTNGQITDTDFTSSDMSSLLTNGTTLNTRWLSNLDGLATWLGQFQTVGIPILFRPLHEMNGGWFWWGSAGGITTAQYQQLWQLTFNYLTNTKGLHNLVWVYSSNAETGNYTAYYPGSAYVDIVGLDIYLPGVSGPISLAGGYQQLTDPSIDKPFAITEFGPVIPYDPNRLTTAPQNYDGLITGIKQNMPNTIYWVSWTGAWGMGVGSNGVQHLNVSQLLSDSWVVNRGDITLGSQPPPTKIPSAHTGLRVN